MPLYIYIYTPSIQYVFLFCFVLFLFSADINVQNTGTKWTPLHCAAFQGHGPVIMILMAQQPNLTLKDAKARLVKE